MFVYSVAVLSHCYERKASKTGNNWYTASIIAISWNDFGDRSRPRQPGVRSHSGEPSERATQSVTASAAVITIHKRGCGRFCGGNFLTLTATLPIVGIGVDEVISSTRRRSDNVDDDDTMFRENTKLHFGCSPSDDSGYYRDGLHILKKKKKNVPVRQIQRHISMFN